MACADFPLVVCPILTLISSDKASPWFSCFSLSSSHITLVSSVLSLPKLDSFHFHIDHGFLARLAGSQESVFLLFFYFC